MNSDVEKSATGPATSGGSPAFALSALPYAQEALEQSCRPRRAGDQLV